MNETAEMLRLHERIRRQQTLLDLAKKMREAQARYFKTRSKNDLVESIALERQFDAAAARDANQQ